MGDQRLRPGRHVLEGERLRRTLRQHRRRQGHPDAWHPLCRRRRADLVIFCCADGCHPRGHRPDHDHRQHHDEPRGRGPADPARRRRVVLAHWHPPLRAAMCRGRARSPRSVAASISAAPRWSAAEWSAATCTCRDPTSHWGKHRSGVFGARLGAPGHSTRSEWSVRRPPGCTQTLHSIVRDRTSMGG